MPCILVNFMAVPKDSHLVARVEKRRYQYWEGVFARETASARRKTVHATFCSCPISTRRRWRKSDRSFVDVAVAKGRAHGFADGTDRTREQGGADRPRAARDLPGVEQLGREIPRSPRARHAGPPTRAAAHDAVARGHRLQRPEGAQPVHERLQLPRPDRIARGAGGEVRGAGDRAARVRAGAGGDPERGEL